MTLSSCLETKNGLFCCLLKDGTHTEHSLLLSSSALATCYSSWWGFAAPPTPLLRVHRCTSCQSAFFFLVKIVFWLFKWQIWTEVITDQMSFFFMFLCQIFIFRASHTSVHHNCCLRHAAEALGLSHVSRNNCRHPIRIHNLCWTTTSNTIFLSIKCCPQNNNAVMLQRTIYYQVQAPAFRTALYPEILLW